MSQQVARVKHQAPNFSGVAYSNKDFVNIELSTLLKEGKWVVLFFWPLDFTFVCPTEIKAFSERHEKFTAAGVNLVGCSVDSQFSHHAWCTSTAKGALGPVNFPMLSDIGGKIAKQYGCLIEQGQGTGVALRATYIIDPKGVLRHLSINDLPLGRNPDEVLRLVQALQYSDQNGEVCPANWKKGDKGLVPKLE